MSAARLTRKDLRAPFRGVRVLASTPRAIALAEHCLEFAPRLKEWQFFSHETALALVGAPLPEWPHRPAVHVSAHRPSREPRTPGVIGHRLQLRVPATWIDAHGLPVEHPVRAWRQAGGSWRLDDLVAAGDYLISGERPIATTTDLVDEIERMGDLRGGILLRALACVRPGVRSARETRLRLVLLGAGLPVPEINWTLRDRRRRHVAELDLAYPRWRVGVEYDGRVHAEDAKQFESDADRWDRIRAEGWDHVRILNHHMRDGGAPAIRRVREALIRAGWTPGC